jgi:DMSO reductase anchor subunit
LDILSAGVLGGFLFLVLGGSAMPHSLLKSLAAAMLSVLVIAMVVNIAYDVQVEMALASLAAQGAAVPSMWLGTLLRLLVGLIVPVYLVYKSLAAEPQKQLSTFSIALVCVIIGEAAARVMHFIVAVKGPFI